MYILKYTNLQNMRRVRVLSTIKDYNHINLKKYCEEHLIKVSTLIDRLIEDFLKTKNYTNDNHKASI